VLCELRVWQQLTLCMGLVPDQLLLEQLQVRLQHRSLGQHLVMRIQLSGLHQILLRLRGPRLQVLLLATVPLNHR
jgi:hypothetical protein